MIRYSRSKQLLFRSMALRQLRGIRVEFIDRDMTTRERKAVRQFQRSYLHEGMSADDINAFLQVEAVNLSVNRDKK